MAEVKIKGISKSFVPGTFVLDNLDLNINSGEIFFLLGPSGCGKSTLLRILAGLVKPDAGTISFDGTDISNLPPEKRRAAMVFQNYALWPHMDVFDNVAFGLRTAKMAEKDVKVAVAEALEQVRLSDYAHRKIQQLSGGQQQRVALARALAVNPALLLLDEPLSNLDARLRDTMRNEIRRICRERNLTALYVTHDRQEALSMGDRLAVMNHGIICQLGTPEEVYNHPTNCFAAEFLGDVNFIEGVVENNNTLKTSFGVFKFKGENIANNTNLTAGIRPERISFSDDGFEAVITDRVFLGESCDWYCKVNDNVDLLVRESAPQSRKVGDVVKLSFDLDYLIALTK